MIPNFISNPDPSIYLSNNYAVLDFETSNIDKGNAVLKENFLVHTSIGRPGKGWTRIRGDEIELSNHLDMFNEVDFIIAHNAKFELQWLIRAGLDIQGILVYDTMLGEYVIKSNRSRRIDLNSSAARYGLGSKSDYISYCIKKGICPSELPYGLLSDYCDKDVVLTHRPFLKQREELKKRGLLPVFFTRCIFTPVLAELEMTGLKLDKELVDSVHRESVEEYNTIIEELNTLTGGINMNSPAQVSEFIYNELKFTIPKKYGHPMLGKATDLFPKGQPMTNEEAIGKLTPKTKKQKRFIELKKRSTKLHKKITSFTKSFSKACEDNDCMIHGTLNQAVTVTQRLSSSAPNVQQIPRDLKKTITSRHPGWKIRQNDFAKLEFVVAGFLAQCPDVLAFLEAGKDPHYEAAAAFFGEAFTSLHKSDPEYSRMRTAAKSKTFLPLYGGVYGTEEEMKYYEAFKDKYTGIKKWHSELIEEALDNKKVVARTGLTFYYPKTEYMSRGGVKNERIIKNYPVQNFAHEIVAPAVTLLWHHMKDKGLKSFMVNEVHDSVIIEQHPDEIEIMNKLSESCMERGAIKYLKQVFNIDYNFPLKIDQDVTDNWGYNK